MIEEKDKIQTEHLIKMITTEPLERVPCKVVAWSEMPDPMGGETDVH